MIQPFHGARQTTAESRRAFRFLSPEQQTDLIHAIAAGTVRL